MITVRSPITSMVSVLWALGIVAPLVGRYGSKPARHLQM